MEESPTNQYANSFQDFQKSKTLVHEFFQKEKNSGEELKIIFGIQNSYIKMIIREGIDIFICQLNLSELSSKNKYFKMFDTIEEAYNDLLSPINDNKYEITKEEDNTIIINIEIEYSYTKYNVPFILEKFGTKKEEKIELAQVHLTEKNNNNSIIENNFFKELNYKINKLDEKLNSFERKINTIYEYINSKKKKKIK